MNEKIDADYNDTLNLTKLPEYLSEIEISLLCENIEENHTDDNDNNENSGLNLKDNNELANQEEIPAVTIKKQINTENCKFKCKKQSEQKIIPMNIFDILSSKSISQNPNCYYFMDIDYKYTIIVGTITSIKYRKEDKINIEVDDGTGCINCVINKFENEINYKKNIKDLSEICNNQEQFDKKEVLRLANGEESFDEETFLISATNMFLKKITKQLNQWPSIEDLKIGDQVSIVGNISDFQDQRLMFAKHVHREFDDCAYFNHMLTITQRKQQMTYF